MRYFLFVIILSGYFFKFSSISLLNVWSEHTYFEQDILTYVKTWIISQQFLRQNHFDGLDLDWEYPAFRDGSKPKDREHYAKLVKELREEFERESQKTGKSRLLLTMAVPAGIEYIQKGYDLKTLNK